MRSARELKNIAQSSAKRESQKSNDVAPLLPVPKKTSGFYGSYRNNKTREKERIEGRLAFPLGACYMVPGLCYMAEFCRLYQHLTTDGQLRFFSSLIYVTPSAFR
jgi:hypothetical protein